MAAEAIVIPLWGKLLLLSVAKKGAIVTAGYLYGVPRLYRRSQKLARLLTTEQATRQQLQHYLRTAFRLPARLLHLQPKPYSTPARQYLSLLPSRLLPPAKAQRTQPVHTSPPVRMYRRLKTSFASSDIVQRHSDQLAAGRATLLGLREQFTLSGTLQNMVEGRRAHAAEMWTRVKLRPYNFVPAIQ